MWLRIFSFCFFFPLKLGQNMEFSSCLYCCSYHETLLNWFNVFVALLLASNHSLSPMAHISQLSEMEAQYSSSTDFVVVLQ